MMMYCLECRFCGSDVFKMALIIFYGMGGEYNSARLALEAHLSPRDDPGIRQRIWPAMARMYCLHNRAPTALASSCKCAKFSALRRFPS